jgi:hypothetical protein
LARPQKSLPIPAHDPCFFVVDKFTDASFAKHRYSINASYKMWMDWSVVINLRVKCKELENNFNETERLFLNVRKTFEN